MEGRFDRESRGVDGYGGVRQGDKSLSDEVK